VAPAGEFGNTGGMAETWTVITAVVLLGIALLGVFAFLARHRGRSRQREESSLSEALAPPPAPGVVVHPGPRNGPPKLSDEDAGPYPGSARPGPDGAPPSDRFIVKADEARRVYYVPGVPEFVRVRADVWFLSADEAESAGFHPVTPRAG
jgi:hypothetical protein